MAMSIPRKILRVLMNASPFLWYTCCIHYTIQRGGQYLMHDIFTFLSQNVNGRTLHTDELVYTLEDGALQGVYSDQISFSNLRRSEHALSIDMFIVSNEKIYEAAGGGRGPLRKDESAVSLFRYELARRKSTGNVTGCFRFISATGRDVMAEAIVSGVHAVRVEDGVLRLREDQALYRDQHSEGGYCPAAFSADQRFYLQGGKLHFEYDAHSFGVDPATMQRAAEGDHYPTFHSVEK